MPPTTQPPDDPRMIRMHRTFDRIAPFLWPLLIVVSIITLVIVGAFGIMAYQQIPLGWTNLDVSVSSSVGDFIGGTIGTAFTAITSLLLVITLWVQINEYKLTREELINTVKAQQAMAASQEAQLEPLREQARVGRQTMEMDLLTKALFELKEDMRTFNGEGRFGLIGCQQVVEHMVHSCVRPGGWLELAMKGEHDPVLNDWVGWTARTLTTLDIFLERAELILRELNEKELPQTLSLIRRKELILGVNNNMRGLAAPLSDFRTPLYQLPEKPIGLKYFKEQCIPQLEGMVDVLMKFSKMNLIATRQVEV